jgi:transcriptional regulator with XRE-family HTH domain
MEQLAGAPPPDGSFGALLRALRHRAYLSQEQLAARAELSERMVRNIEAGRVRSPRTDTVRLLADALALTEPERKSWIAAAQGANGRQAKAGLPRSSAWRARACIAVLRGRTDASGPAITA